MRPGGSRKNSGEERCKDEKGEAPGTFDPQCEMRWSQCQPVRELQKRFLCLG